MLKIFTKTKIFILDTLFPISCLSCNKDDAWLCENCLENINLLSFQVCPKCEDTVTEYGQLCRNCKTTSDLDALVVALKYQDNHIDKFVHLYKYRFVEDLHIPLGKIIVEAILNSGLPMPDIIIPVPLHKRRLRWRGFNQSELLAKYVSQNLTPGFEIPVFSNLLTRHKYTPPQMKIGKYADRQKNMRNAFAFNHKSDSFQQLEQLEHSNKYNVLLVDDISTTGSTLFECAKVLKQNGAKKVFGAVIARQDMKN
ncbi:MAG: ComF family protein [Candidatus Moranbacteria bacterium]|nr:ComF family protein [Candidatus Moranbacteria bacterium]